MIDAGAIAASNPLDAHKPLLELPQYYVRDRKTDGEQEMGVPRGLPYLAGGLRGVVGFTKRSDADFARSNACPGSLTVYYDYPHLLDFLTRRKRCGVQVLVVFLNMPMSFVDAGDRPVCFGISIDRAVSEIATAIESGNADSPILVPGEAYAMAETMQAWRDRHGEQDVGDDTNASRPA